MIDDDRQSEYCIGAIHDELGYQKIREALSTQYNLGSREPDIQVVAVDVEGDRTLTLHYTQHHRVPLGKTTPEVLKHLYRIWKFPVMLKAVNDQNEVTAEYRCPPQETPKT
jgi:spore cortex formation protein SpoVR/YcgB (stage V sporulation)